MTGVLIRYRRFSAKSVVISKLNHYIIAFSLYIRFIKRILESSDKFKDIIISNFGIVMILKISVSDEIIARVNDWQKRKRNLGR